MKLGSYNLIRKIAEGGVAEIYLAKSHTKQGGDKYLVCKCIKDSLTSDTDFLASIIREAQLSIRMRHSNILEVFDLCSIDGRAFLTMEYMNAPDFQHILQDCRLHGETIPFGAAIYVITQTARGLHYAHELQDGLGQPLNLVHRDISPENILLNSRGGVKLSDFGIAKTCQMPDITPPDIVKGKFAYMSPEQAWAVRLDRRSDLFSLAIVLYEALLGRTFYNQNLSIADILVAARTAHFDRPSDVQPDFPEDLEQIMLRALDLDKQQRYETADDFRIALEECAAAHEWDCSCEYWCNWLLSRLNDKPVSLPIMRAAEIPDDPASIIRHKDRSFTDLTPDFDRTVIVSKKMIEEQEISSSSTKIIRDRDIKSALLNMTAQSNEHPVLHAIKLPSELVSEKFKHSRQHDAPQNTGTHPLLADSSGARTSENSTTTAQLDSPFYGRNDADKIADIAIPVSSDSLDKLFPPSADTRTNAKYENPCSITSKTLSSATDDSTCKTADLPPTDDLPGLSLSDTRRAHSDSQISSLHEAASASRIGPASLSMPAVSQGLISPNVTRPTGMKSEIIPVSTVSTDDAEMKFHAPTERIDVGDVDFSLTIPEINAAQFIGNLHNKNNNNNNNNDNNYNNPPGTEPFPRPMSETHSITRFVVIGFAVVIVVVGIILFIVLKTVD